MPGHRTPRRAGVLRPDLDDAGQTEFARCRAACDDCEAGEDGTPRESLHELVCEHSIAYSRSLVIDDFFTDEENAAMPPVRQRPGAQESRDWPS
jgi:hypothetical protein